MKILNILGDLGSFLKWGGVLTAAYDHQNSHWVAACLGIGIIGLILDKAIRASINIKINELDQANSREWSYLNIIRIKSEKAETIDKELLVQAKNASKEADQIYKNIYGFYRPATAIKISPEKCPMGKISEENITNSQQCLPRN